MTQLPRQDLSQLKALLDQAERLTQVLNDSETPEDKELAKALAQELGIIPKEESNDASNPNTSNG